MSSLGTIGEICHQHRPLHVEWKVKDVFSLSKVVDSYYCSPTFYLLDYSFYLQLYSNGESEWSSEGWIGLYLIAAKSFPPIEVQFTVGFKTAKEEIEHKSTDSNTFSEKDAGFGKAKALRRTELRRLDLTPSDVLTISATLKIVPNSIEGTTDVSVQTDTEDAKSNTENEGCQGTEQTGTTDVSVQTDIEDAISNIENEGCQDTEPTGGKKVLEDIGKLWRSSENSDVVIQVEDVEFKAHRAILGARTPVLGAMFQHDTIEKETGVVTISDCEPAIFEELLHYIYTGVPRELTTKKAPALYAVANKYLVGELMAQCLCYIRDNLCVDSFCDTASLALKFGEAELLEFAVEFATKNIRKIIKSVEWERFGNEHFTAANEILIKALGPE